MKKKKTALLAVVLRLFAVLLAMVCNDLL